MLLRGHDTEARAYWERAAAVKARHPYVGYDVGELGGEAGEPGADGEPSPGSEG